MGGQPKRFQYILNIRGVITEVLANAPDGWLNTAIKYTRSKTYQGIFRGETLATKYVTKASYLLRTELYNYGVLGFVRIAINLLNQATWGYNSIYSGRLDFSTAQDDLSSITINSVTDDFTLKLNANDSINYMIPVDVDEAVNIELTPLAVHEEADIIFNNSPDFRANAFFELGVANNQQNSVNNSVQKTGFLADTSPVFDDSNSNEWFYVARIDTNIRIQGNINASVNSGHYQFNIYKTGGTLVRTLSEVTNSVTLQNNFSWDFAISLNQGEKLFFYIKRLDSSATTPGVNMQAGTMHLEYLTISPATMCKALPASYVFGQILQAMNTNTDSGPNQPVANKSDLLTTGPLSQLVITCSDSIRNAVGSIVYPGDTVFPGFYKVIQGSISYGAQTFNLGDQFSYLAGVLTFTGTGVVQKVISGFVGTVYNPGDDLQAGGTYLVGGNPGTHVTYNALSYNIGQTFIYVLGQTTFTGSDDSSFVQQVGVSIQLIINFKDFFQSVYSVMCGNCSFGIENLGSVQTCFIENLAYVYRSTIGNLDAGKVDTGIKITPAMDIIPNSIKIGYRDNQYSTLNGYSEVNSEQTYVTSIINPVRALNLISVIRADPYGIEEIRISQNDTAASRSDNENFFIYKLASSQTAGDFVYYKPQTTEGIMSITGVDASYYNWYLSPKHCLLRGAPYLASLFYKMAGYSLTLSAAPKNTALVVVDGSGVRVAEADPVQISSLGLPLFLPFYATFKPGIEQGGLQMIDSVPYGFIRFTYNGTQYKMFAEEISVDIGQNSQQEFKGLFTPDNDLRTLIH